MMAVMCGRGVVCRAPGGWSLLACVTTPLQRQGCMSAAVGGSSAPFLYCLCAGATQHLRAMWRAARPCSLGRGGNGGLRGGHGGSGGLRGGHGGSGGLRGGHGGSGGLRGGRGDSVNRHSVTIAPSWHRGVSDSTRVSASWHRGVSSDSARVSAPWRTLFFGTDEYAVEHLKALNDNRMCAGGRLVDYLEVVAPKSKCAVADYAAAHGLTVHTWTDRGVQVDRGRFDVGVVVSFGHLIPPRVIDAFPRGILNVHPSVLPRWRGAAPIIHTVLNGDAETGVSVLTITPSQFDVGPLLLQARYAVPDNCTTFQLRDYLAAEGATLLLRALSELRTLRGVCYAQDTHGVTHARKLSAVNARVHWERQGVTDIDRQYRALAQIFGLRSQWRGQPIRLLDMVPPVELQAGEVERSLLETFPHELMIVRPGIAHYCTHLQLLYVRCQDGWVGFQGITLKKPMSAKSFHNGYLSKPEHRATAFESLDNELDRHLVRHADIRAEQRADRHGAGAAEPLWHRRRSNN